MHSNTTGSATGNASQGPGVSRGRAGVPLLKCGVMLSPRAALGRVLLRVALVLRAAVEMEKVSAAAAAVSV
eukprot:7966842-Alexandrium_andersonii.AAC.1